jgi:hypothetical protein
MYSALDAWLMFAWGIAFAILAQYLATGWMDLIRF